MASRIKISSDAEGRTKVETREAAQDEIERLENMMDSGGVEAPSHRRMFKKASELRDSPVFQEFEVDGEKLYARAFDYDALLEFNMIAKRDKAGAIKVSTDTDRRALVVALLVVGIVTAPSHDAPRRFTRDEAMDGCDSLDPDDWAKLGQMTGRVVLLNPHIFPQAKEKIDQQAREIAEAEAAAKNAFSEPLSASTTSPNTLPTNGSPSTESTAKPVISPSNSMAATDSNATEPATSS